MKPFTFFAMLSRMKYINRWGLMRNARTETLSEHTLDVAYIAHALALLSDIDPAQAVMCALYHDCNEIITGDLPTPVKYRNEEIRRSYHLLEDTAKATLLSGLPAELDKRYRSCFFEDDPLVLKIVKAADKLSALIKCIEEQRMGNEDFRSARVALLEAINALELPAADRFLELFLPAYELTLDELTQETTV